MEMRTGGGTMFSVSDLIGVGGDISFFSNSGDGPYKFLNME
jgi:hypothetical protein